MKFGHSPTAHLLPCSRFPTGADGDRSAAWGVGDPCSRGLGGHPLRTCVLKGEGLSPGTLSLIQTLRHERRSRALLALLSSNVRMESPGGKWDFVG